jgi:uncharacterized protein YdiU (UPF0061 family)
LREEYGLSARLVDQCYFGRGPPAGAAGAAGASTRVGMMRELLHHVTMRTAALVAAWMAVGFAHGVMNTVRCA